MTVKREAFLQTKDIQHTELTVRFNFCVHLNVRKFNSVLKAPNLAEIVSKTSNKTLDKTKYAQMMSVPMI